MMRKKMEEKVIELSPQELEDIKYTIKFRECVMLKLKALKDIPEKITVLETKMVIYVWIMRMIILGILGLAFKVLVRG